MGFPSPQRREGIGKPSGKKREFEIKKERAESILCGLIKKEKAKEKAKAVKE